MRYVLCVVALAALAVGGCAGVSVTPEQVAAVQAQVTALSDGLTAAEAALVAARSDQAADPDTETQAVIAVLQEQVEAARTALAGVQAVLADFQRAATVAAEGGGFPWADVLTGVLGVVGLVFGVGMFNSRAGWVRLVKALAEGVQAVLEAEEPEAAGQLKGAITMATMAAGQHDKLAAVLVEKGYSKAA